MLVCSYMHYSDRLYEQYSHFYFYFLEQYSKPKHDLINAQNFQYTGGLIMSCCVKCHQYITFAFHLSLHPNRLQQQICCCSKAANRRMDRSSHIWCFRGTGARCGAQSESAQTDVWLCVAHSLTLTKESET